jgi:hypothetical protein
MRSLRLALALAVALLLPVLVFAQSNVSLWGTVVWTTGAPAAGVALRVKRQGVLLQPMVYTNQVGRYGLYGLSPPTSDYTLEILKSGKVIKTVSLPEMKLGQRVPDIIVP